MTTCATRQLLNEHSFSVGTAMLLLDRPVTINNHPSLNCSYTDSNYWLNIKLTWKKLTQHKQKKK